MPTAYSSQEPARHEGCHSSRSIIAITGDALSKCIHIINTHSVHIWMAANETQLTETASWMWRIDS